MKNVDGKEMTGLEILSSPELSVEQKADIICQDCPPAGGLTCNKVSCKKCWIVWLSGKGGKKEESNE